MASDEELREEILARLCWNDCILNSGIEVSVKNRGVRLSGQVPTARMRVETEKAAGGVRGVAGVENHIVVKPPSGPGDEDLAAGVKNMLDWTADIDAGNIDVSASNGHIALEGWVDAFWQRQRAADIALDLEGVTGVTNRLEVLPSKSASDEDIKEDILEQIGRSESLTEANIEVRVNGGKVTMTGTAPTWDGRLEAQEIARYTTGVTSVENRISAE